MTIVLWYMGVSIPADFADILSISLYHSRRVLIVAVLTVGVKVSAELPVLPLIAFYLCFIFTCFGFGLIGAGNFFTLR